MPFVHLATAMPLDVVLAGSGLEDRFLDRARDTDIGGTTVPVIDPEDLIVAKVLAGRPKDIEDARSLWRLRGPQLDADGIRGVLRLIEEALGQSDCYPVSSRFCRRRAGGSDWTSSPRWHRPARDHRLSR